MGEDAAAATLGGRYRVGELVASDPRRQVHDGYDLVLRRRVSLIRAEGVDPQAAMPAPPAAALCPRPGVARVFDAGTWDGRLTFVTETVPAPSLADLRDRRHRCDPTTLLDVGTRVARVLASLHAQGVAHGALTPAQVLLGPEGPVLTEVGLAGALTRWTGTPPPGRYRPPDRAAGADELAEATEATGPADDVYALGRILAEVAPPRAGLGPAVDDLVGRMTRPDPRERPSMAAVADALAAARAPVAAQPRSRRRPPIGLATAVAAAGLATASCVGAVLLAGAPATQGARVPASAAVPVSAGPPAAPVVVPLAPTPRPAVTPPVVLPSGPSTAAAIPTRPRDDDGHGRDGDVRTEDRPGHGAGADDERADDERADDERADDERADDQRSPDGRTEQDDA